MKTNLQFLWQNFRFRNALTTSSVVGLVAGAMLLTKGGLQSSGYNKLVDFGIAVAVIESSRRCAFAALDLADTGADLEYTERRALVANHHDNLRQLEQPEPTAIAASEPLSIVEDVVSYWLAQQKHLMIIGGTGSGKTYFMQKLVKHLPKWYIKVYDIDATVDDWQEANLVANRYPEIEEQMLEDLDGIEELADQRDKQGSKSWKPQQMRLIIVDEFPVTLDQLKETATTWSTTHAKRTRKLGRFIALMVQNDTVKNTGLKGDNGVRDSCYTRVYLGIDALKRAKLLQDKRVLEWLKQHNQYDVCLVDDLPAMRIK
jgi:hypothetical protein